MFHKIVIGLLSLAAAGALVSMLTLTGKFIFDAVQSSKEEERKTFAQCFQAFSHSPTETLSCAEVLEKMNELK